MKKYRLWENVYGVSLLIEDEKVYPAVEAEDLIFVDLPTDMIDELNAAPKEERLTSPDEVRDWIETVFGKTVYVNWGDIYEEPHETVVFDPENQTFSNFADWPYTTEAYDWWDGSNWRTEVLFPFHTETIVEVGNNYVSLDEWDGRNWTTGGMGHHQHVYRVHTVDGKKVENTFLLVEISDWQRDHDTARILDRDELIAHLQKLNRDIPAYLSEIDALR